MMWKLLTRIREQLKNYSLFISLKRNYPKLYNPLYLLYYKNKIKRIIRTNSIERLINLSKIGKNLIDFIFLGKGVIYSQQIDSEIKSLGSLIKKQKPKYIIEIGTAGGGTLLLFSQLASSDAIIISIDLPGGFFGGGYPKWKKKLYNSFISKNQKLFLIQASSHDSNTIQKVKSILKSNKIDFLFIDGDHTYEGVKKDFYLYNKFVKENGYIALHDIMGDSPAKNVNVKKFWNELKNSYNILEFIANKNQDWAGIGVITYKKK